MSTGAGGLQVVSLEAMEVAAERVRRAAGIRVERIATLTATSRTHFYRRLDAVFETLAELSEHDRDAAFAFAMFALMYGLDRRESKR